MSIELVYAREPVPAGRPSVMLLGPTAVAGTIPSWRPRAVELIEAGWRGDEPLVVLTPESRGGVRARTYEDQLASELEMIESADAAMFWIPRDVVLLPGFTTNVEFGLIAGTCPERAVLGAPPDCPNPERNRYLIWHARRLGIPVCDTLPETVFAALALVTARHERTEGSRLPIAG